MAMNLKDLESVTDLSQRLKNLREMLAYARDTSRDLVEIRVVRALKLDVSYRTAVNALVCADLNHKIAATEAELAALGVSVQPTADGGAA